jgi:CHAD domain-containing protein
MADEKWISGLRGDMPVAEAARRVFTVRLGAVLDRLPWAVEHADEDIEHVHQLRVGTRRAGAAVRIFADCLPAKLYRQTRRVLRAVRRAAGAARDWDVFLDMLNARRGRPDSRQRAGLDFLLGFGHGQRVFAQGHLREATAGKTDRLRRLLVEIGTALDAADHARTLRDLAVPMLTNLIRELEEAARGDLHAYEALHRVRILGKQLRYAMELFESCFGPAFREEIYPSVVAMQEILGRANDSHVASVRLDELRARVERAQPKDWARYKPACDQLLLYHRRRLPEQRRHFEDWWAAWQSRGHAAALEKLLMAAVHVPSPRRDRRAMSG